MLVRVCFLLVFLFFITIVESFRYNSLWNGKNTFAPAICTARCVRDLAHFVDARASANNTKTYLLRMHLQRRPYAIEHICFKKFDNGSYVYPICSSCVQSCRKAQTQNCNEFCNKIKMGHNYESLTKGCKLGCHYFKHASIVRSGTCPNATNQISERSRNCFRDCNEDSNCRGKMKCCPNSCDTLSCTEPVYNSSLPQTDTQPHIWELPNKKAFDIRWWMGEKIFPENYYLNPIIYVVQIRDYVGEEFQVSRTRSWKPLLMTPLLEAHLGDVMVGTWYQFRVASVTAEGTRGFLQMSTPLKLSITPRVPTAPRNVSDGVWRIHSGGSINVQINWSPPAISDFPISRYQIRWVQDHGYVQSDGKSLESLTRFKQAVPGDRSSYTIENLLPSTSYKIEVTAQARWGLKVLKSPPNTLFITTPKMYDPETKYEAKETNEDGGCVCKQNEQSGLYVYAPTYQNGTLTTKVFLTKTDISKDERLSYLIEWSPKVCIATSSENNLDNIGGKKIAVLHKSLKDVTGLAFNCRYQLNAWPLEHRQDEYRLSTCFCTPACRDVRVEKNSKPPKCSPDTSLPVPSRPTNIMARRVGHQSFALTWSRPKTSRYFNKFRVIWGPREEEPVNKDIYGDSGLSPKIDFNLAETKVVSNNITSLLLTNLRDATMYIVKIQALTYRDGTESESPEGVHYFTTDGFTNPPTVPDYRAVVSQYVKHGIENGKTILAPCYWVIVSTTVLLHFVLLRDCT